MALALRGGRRAARPLCRSGIAGRPVWRRVGRCAVCVVCSGIGAVPAGAVRAGHGDRRAGRHGDPAGDAHAASAAGQVFRSRQPRADVRLPRRAGGVAAVSAGAGAAPRAGAHRFPVRTVQYCDCGLDALALPRRAGAHGPHAYGDGVARRRSGSGIAGGLWRIGQAYALVGTRALWGRDHPCDFLAVSTAGGDAGKTTCACISMAICSFPRATNIAITRRWYCLRWNRCAVRGACWCWAAATASRCGRS